MSDELFNFELITPSKVLISESVNFVRIQGVEGDMTIFANHSPIATALRPGYLNVVLNNKSENYFVTGGFVQIIGDEVVILAENAILESEVSLEMIDQTINKTKNLMENASELQKCVLAKKLNDLTIIKSQL